MGRPASCWSHSCRARLVVSSDLIRVTAVLSWTCLGRSTPCSGRPPPPLCYTLALQPLWLVFFVGFGLGIGSVVLGVLLLSPSGLPAASHRGTPLHLMCLPRCCVRGTLFWPVTAPALLHGLMSMTDPCGVLSALQGCKLPLTLLPVVTKLWVWLRTSGSANFGKLPSPLNTLVYASRLRTLSPLTCVLDGACLGLNCPPASSAWGFRHTGYRRSCLYQAHVGVAPSAAAVAALGCHAPHSACFALQLLHVVVSCARFRRSC